MLNKKQTLGFILFISLLVIVSIILIFMGKRPDFIIKNNKLIKYLGNEEIVNIPEGITIIEDDAFRTNNSIKEIYIPRSVNLIKEKALLDLNVNSIRVSEENKNYISVDGILFSKDMTQLIKFPCEKKCEDSVYFVPEEIEKICYGAFKSSNLCVIFLPENVMEISDSAFANCNNLEIIHMNRKVSKIGKKIFNESNEVTVNCYKYSNMAQYAQNNNLNIEYYPDLLVYAAVYWGGGYSIEEDTWNSATYDEDFIIENGILIRYNGSGGKVKIPEGVTEIGCHAFASCKGLFIVNIPRTVTKIDKEAFVCCDDLITVLLPENLITIDEYAFSHCYNLTSISLPGNLKSIGKGAFTGSGLINIKIPDSVTNIGEDVFSLCNDLRYVSMSKNMDKIPDKTFDRCKNLLDVEISNSIKTIGSYAFYCCNNLKEINIPNSVVCIKNHAFNVCNNLKEINLSSNIIFIGEAAFEECINLEKIELPKKLASIGERLFFDCVNLHSITIPKNIKVIGRKAFYLCKNLKNITILSMKTKVYYNSFAGCNRDMIIRCNKNSTIYDFAINNGIQCKELIKVNYFIIIFIIITIIIIIVSVIIFVKKYKNNPKHIYRINTSKKIKNNNSVEKCQSIEKFIIYQLKINAINSNGFCSFVKQIDNLLFKSFLENKQLKYSNIELSDNNVYKFIVLLLLSIYSNVKNNFDIEIKCNELIEFIIKGTTPLEFSNMYENLINECEFTIDELNELITYLKDNYGKFVNDFNAKY